MWQLECRASNVTASVQSGHLVHGYMLPVFFTTDQLHRPPCSAEIQPMSQQDASASCPYRGLVLDIRYTRSCSMPQMQQFTVLRSGLMNCGVLLRRNSTVSRARCASALSCWKTNTSPAMLQIAVAASASATCLGNTARWFLLQAQRIWGWYNRVWLLQERVYRVPIQVAEASCCNMDWISAERGGTQHYIQSDEKVMHFTRYCGDWWHFSQGVVGKGATVCFLLR